MQGKILKLAMMMLVAHNVQAEEMIFLEDRTPSLEFLEYLGEMIETEGELVGPVTFDESDQQDTGSRGQDQWISSDNPQWQEVIREN